MTVIGPVDAIVEQRDFCLGLFFCPMGLLYRPSMEAGLGQQTFPNCFRKLLVPFRDTFNFTKIGRSVKLCEAQL